MKIGQPIWTITRTENIHPDLVVLFIFFFFLNLFAFSFFNSQYLFLYLPISPII